MRVRIVCYEEVHSWILGKFALRLNEELLKLGIASDIEKEVDHSADINHHIIYIDYQETRGSKSDTLMITHINDIRKLNQLKRQFGVALMGICMSRSTAEELKMAGLPSEKLCYIDPAHDSVMVPKKYIVGITSKVQPDGCKREDMLLKLTEKISPELFEFKIMGAAWEDIIKTLRKRGFTVTYFPQFNYDEYVKLVPTFDYYLYMGQDEGSMGFIDALAAGIKTIVTPQGYHLDAPNGLVHPFNTQEELLGIFNSIAEEKQKLIHSVSQWTWRDYAIKHVELWEHLLHPEKKINSVYKDGLNSLLNPGDTREFASGTSRNSYKLQLYLGAIRRIYFKGRKIKDYKTFKIKLNNLVNNLFRKK